MFLIIYCVCCNNLYLVLCCEKFDFFAAEGIFHLFSLNQKWSNGRPSRQGSLGFADTCKKSKKVNYLLVFINPSVNLLY